MGSTYQELRKKLNQGRRDLAQLEKYLKEGETLERDIEKNAYLVEERLGKIEERLAQFEDLKDLREDLQRVREFVEEKKRLLDPAKQTLRNYLGAELDRRFREQGWQISGNVPELRVGLLTLEFLLTQGQVRIWFGPRIELLGKARLSVDSITDTVTTLYKDLEGASFKDEEEFLRLLFDAYGRCIIREGLAPGATLPIIRWLGEIAWQKQGTKFLADPRREHFTSYGRVQLSYDLFRTKRRQYNDHELRLGIASREQTKRMEENLWVPQSPRGDGTHFASVCFISRAPR
ncbi:MAG: hypothetical protein ACMUIL_11015 [bacterium]